MALARVKTWNPGDTLTAADLNAEFNNILNNPISLVSPTTGAINFQTSVAHTNLQVSALTASSGFAGSVLVTSTAATPAPLWSTGATAGGVFIATTAGIPTWSTGAIISGVLIVTTSGIPTWSTGAGSGGVFVASTATTPTWLAIGTSGQVLTISTSLTPVWRTGGGGILHFNTGANTVNTTALTDLGPSGAVNQTAYTVPFPGIARGFSVSADALPTAGQTFTYTLRRNSVNQTPSVVITTSFASVTGTDLTNTTTYANGDTISVAVVLSSVGANTAHRALVGYGQTS